MTDVSGRLITLHQLEAELIAAGVAVPNGLVIVGAWPPGQQAPTGSAIQPPGTQLLGVAPDQQYIELPPEAESVIDHHVAMRDKTDAEFAAEFQLPETTPARKQELRDMQAGLLPREQVPM
jgi:hypothetical protein